VRDVVIIEGHRPTLMPEGPAIERAVFGDGAAIHTFGELRTVPADLLQRAHAVIVRPGTPFGADSIDRLEACRVIVALGVGYEHIDLSAARRRSIPVCNTPDYGVDEVADTALAMALYLYRKLSVFHRHAAGGSVSWDWRLYEPIKRTRHSLFGILGLGKIGTSVALKAKAVGFQVQFFDPYKPRGIEKSLGIARLHDRDDLVRSSDIVSIHTPLTMETAGMIDDAFLSLMKQESVLVNTARGGLFAGLDPLYRALKELPGLAVGTDVLPEEPPGDHPLLREWRTHAEWLFGRFLLTPHMAFYSLEACQELRRFAAEVAQTVLAGGRPYNVVND
jgi:lactate dehydrogenase-like 2-hydroxyacid dehydrogenase